MSIGYRVEVDRVTEEDWSHLIQCFDDGNIFQTWSYGSVRWGGHNLSHIVLKKDSKVVAMVQAALFKLPVIGIGIAYVRGGPMWHYSGEEGSLDHLRKIVRSLIEEYAERRGLVIRLLPNEVEGTGTQIREIIESQGFHHILRSVGQSRTFIMDVTPPIEELRKRLSRRWKRSLSFTEKQGITIIRGNGEDLVEILSGLYREMVGRKRFVPGVNIDEYCAIQRDLPDPLKMKVIVCEFEKKAISALAVSLIGKKCIALVAGTSSKALTLKSSYLMHWNMIEWLKGCGAHWYDLGGFDPEDNPGTALFKAGLPGREERYVGQFDASENLMGAVLVACFDKARLIWRRGKISFNRIQNEIRETFEHRKGRSEENDESTIC